MSDFIVGDGEGIKNPSDEGKLDLYVYLNFFDGSDYLNIESSTGLSSLDIFDFIYQHKKFFQNKTCFFYGANYDWTKFLISLTKIELERLYKTKNLFYKGYKIQVIPSKMFKLYKGTVCIFKAFDFYHFCQTKFTDALQNWLGIEDKVIQDMKAQRQSFTLEALDEVILYNRLELKYLFDIIGRFYEAVEKLDLHPKNFYSPAVLAREVFKREKVKEYIKRPKTNSPLAKCIRSAYFGGWTETYKIGYFNYAVSLDINSAYPYGLSRTVDFRERNFTYVPIFNGELLDIYDLVHVKMIVKHNALNILPVRLKNNNIDRPAHLEGWYWGIELLSILDSYNSDLYYDIEFIDGYKYNVESHRYYIYPFKFLEKLYEQRLEYKNSDLAEEKILKLILNSSYGVLAQQQGLEMGEGSWSNFAYAGWATAWCRSRISKIILQQNLEEQVIGINTDGIYFDITNTNMFSHFGSGFGGVTVNFVEDLLYVGNGFYYIGDKPKTRGISANKIPRSLIEDGYENHVSVLSLLDEKFIGMGIGLQLKEFDYFGCFIPSEYKLNLTQSGQKLAIRFPDKDKNKVVDMVRVDNERLKKSKMFPTINDNAYKEFRQEILF